jgi:hypothetical protein
MPGFLKQFFMLYANPVMHVDEILERHKILKIISS